jgi:hypothetical protein
VDDETDNFTTPVRSPLKKREIPRSGNTHSAFDTKAYQGNNQAEQLVHQKIGELLLNWSGDRFTYRASILTIFIPSKPNLNRFSVVIY